MQAEEAAMTAREFVGRVDAFMVRRYGITWVDACGNAEPIERAVGAGESPEQWAEDWGLKYDLDPIGPSSNE